MLTVRVLDKEHEIDDACSLLYIEYIKKGMWQFSEDNPSELKVIVKNNKKMLIDRITRHAIWFGAFDGNNLVGCIRLFKATDQIPLEMEVYQSAQYIVKQYIEGNKSNIYEGTRVCVNSEYKGKGLLTKLYSSILEYAQKEKASVFGTASNGYIQSVLRRIEWPCKQESAFKFEESDPTSVNFYLADYKNGEIANIIHNIKLLEKKHNQKNLSILDALNMIAPIFPVPMYWHDTKGVVLGANIQCLNGMGKMAEEVLGKTPYDFYPKEIADYIWKHSKQVIKSGETLTQQEYAHDILGKCIGTYLAIKTPLYDDGGNIIGILGTSVDITAQKEAEQLKSEVEKHIAVEAGQKKFQTFVEQLLYVINDYKISSLNNKLGQTQPAVLDGIELTKREREVLYYLSLNKSPKEISLILSILDNKTVNPKSVQAVIDKQLYPKFEVYSTGQLIEKAHIHKLIPFVLE